MPRTRVTLTDPFGVVQASIYVDVMNYEINRELNAASAWTMQFPCTVSLATQVRARWRVSLEEEGRVAYLLKDAIVTTRTFNVSRSGSGVLSLTGGTKLIDMAADNTHVGLAYTGATSMQAIANALTGETVTAPARAATTFPKITFNDVSKLAAFVGAAEMARFNFRENFDGTFELTDKDDVPDSGYKAVIASHAGPDYASAGARGLALIAGTPMIGHDGSNLATRITGFGTDFDGSQLTLEHATRTDPYAVQSGTSPDGSTYWYLKDALAETIYNVVERPLVRSDVKNPNDDATSRSEAANVLYAFVANELLKRRSEIVSFASNFANGNEIDALPGSRIHILFKGFSVTPDGELLWQDIDRAFLVIKRKDSSIRSGIRQVGFTFAAPEEELSIPSAPTAHPIAEPPGEVPDPPEPIDPNEPVDDPSSGDEGEKDVPPWPDVPGAPSFGTPVGEMLKDHMLGRGPLQPCCADPGHDKHGGEHPPPFDLRRACAVPFAAAATQNFRFVEKWGLGWADPGVGDPSGALDPNTDRGVVVLQSSSADPVLVVSGATSQLLWARHSARPANFGGDGDAWWRIYYVIPTAATIDFAGTTGVSRNCTFMRAGANLPSLGIFNDGMEMQFTADLEYSGSHFGHAVEVATANQSSIYGDLVWMFVNSEYRSIDDLAFTKEFNAPAIPFNHDYFRFNSEFVALTPGGGDGSAIDWMFDTKDDAFGSHSVTCRFTADATDLGTFPGACRVLAVCASLRLRALCHNSLLT